MSDIDTIRTKLHYTELYMSIYKPNDIMMGQVNSTGITIGAYQFGVDGITYGSMADIEEGQTIWIGTQPGSCDRGRLRIKAVTGSNMWLAENYEIQWQDNLYLDVKDFFEPWAIYPRLVPNTVVEPFYTYYKDYDIPYSNQNNVDGIIINMGGDYAGWIDDPVYFCATGTYNTDSLSMTYNWEFPNATPASGTSVVPGWVQWSTPGHYTVKLIVTSSSGQKQSSYRHISLYSKVYGSPNHPIKKWGIDNLNGARDTGGYSGDFWVRENLTDVVDGALVVIFADDYYGNNKISVGGNDVNRSSIVFSGYISEGTINYDYANSRASFHVESLTGIMKRREGFSIALDAASNPSTWEEMNNLTVKRSLWHWLKWNSTILNLADVRMNFTDYYMKYADTDPASMYDSINSFAQKRIRGRVVCDRQGAMYIEVDPEAKITATPTKMSITRSDWVNEPEVTEIMFANCDYLELGAEANSSGMSSGTTTLFLACAPGPKQGYAGTSEVIQEGMYLNTQTELNNIVGCMYAYRNAKYPTLRLDMAGNYRIMDIAPVEKYLVTMLASDTVRGIVMTNEPFHIERMDWRYDSSHKSFIPNIDFHHMPTYVAGISIPPPSDTIVNEVDQPLDFPDFAPIGTEDIGGGYITVIPPDEICIKDPHATTNGPYKVYLNRFALSLNEYSYGHLFCSVRQGSADNPSTYVLDGLFEVSNGAGGWMQDNTTDWYSVFAYKGSPSGIVAVAVNDPATGGLERTGHFNPPNGILDVSGFGVTITSNGSGSGDPMAPWTYDGSGGAIGTKIGSVLHLQSPGGFTTGFWSFLNPGSSAQLGAYIEVHGQWNPNYFPTLQIVYEDSSADGVIVYLPGNHARVYVTAPSVGKNVSKFVWGGNIHDTAGDCWIEQFQAVGFAGWDSTQIRRITISNLNMYNLCGTIGSYTPEYPK